METALSKLHVYSQDRSIWTANCQLSRCLSTRTGNSKFCKDHCKLAKENGVPTELRAFLHEYCGIPRKTDDSTLNEHVQSSDVEKVESKRKQLPIGNSSSELTKIQGTSSFLTKNQGLLTVNTESADTSSDPCNKDTGEKQKTLQKMVPRSPPLC
ncbi:uncharacterized protein LOC116291775 [Actinia tenebrosa]|uniref:Uncharacterized protein LOC116291775 n=1 Tax=Actinia tenebrosa TaxID=6105 RepID=A0A6P8HJ05_ACTTE|nr:uncharacterized protein LOC116291775 [Actinia tenebrosa]